MNVTEVNAGSAVARRMQAPHIAASDPEEVQQHGIGVAPTHAGNLLLGKRMMKKLALHAGALLLAILGVTGCGGSGTDEGSQLPGGGLPGAGAPPPVIAAEPAPIKYGDSIVLKSANWRQYLSAQDGNSVQQARYPLEWEEWKVIDADHPDSTAAVKFNDNVRLQSVAKSSWLSAQNDNSAQQASAPLGWEIWQFKDPANSTATGTVTQASAAFLRNVNWNTYLSARQGSAVGHVSAALDWEKWLVFPKGYARTPLATGIRYGDVITARSSFRTYLSAQVGSSVELADHPEAWEKWEIVNPEQKTSTEPVQFNGAVALYAVDKGTFLSAQNDSYARQVAEPSVWEQWTITDPVNRSSTAVVTAIDTVAFVSSWNTWLSAQQTVVQHVANPGPWEQWIVAPDGYFGNWMAREAAAPGAAFGSKPLREITLPASHDAGTWSMKSEMSHDEAAQAFKGPLDAINVATLKFLDGVTKVSIGSFTIDLSSLIGGLRDSCLNAFYDSFKVVSQATRRTSAEQLRDGARWLDLRIDLRGVALANGTLQDGGAYTYHFLTGVKMEDVLDDVAAFVSSRRGEIVVLEMSHFTMDPIIMGLPAMDGLRTQMYSDFADMIDRKLGAYKYAWSATDSTSPLARTYNDIVGTPAQSKVIVLMDGIWKDGPDVHWRGYWTYKDLEVAGKYANKSVLNDMVADQQTKFSNRESNKPFAVFMTLTGQENELIGRVLAGIQARYLQVGFDFIWHSALGAARYVPGVENIIRGLVRDAVNWAFSQIGFSFEMPDWNSLWDLSQKVDPAMHEILETRFQNSATASSNEISVIYADFMDTTFLVETAIRYSRRPAKAAPKPP